MPQRLAVGRIERDEIARHIAAEQQLPGRRQQTRARRATAGRSELVLPDDLAGLVVDRGDEAAQRPDADLVLAAEPHRAARIGLGQVVHRVGFARRHVEQAGVGAVGRRRPVGRRRRWPATPARRRCDVLRRIAHRLSLRVHPLRPVHRVGELARHQVLAGPAIEREVVAVAARASAPSCAAAAAELAVDQHRRLRGIPVVRVVRRRLVVPLHLAGVDVDRDDARRCTGCRPRRAVPDV